MLCLCLMSKMSDVFLYAVPMMLYCQLMFKWQKWLHSEWFVHPLLMLLHLTWVRRTQLTRPCISGWYYPSVPGGSETQLQCVTHTPTHTHIYIWSFKIPDFPEVPGIVLVNLNVNLSLYIIILLSHSQVPLNI